MKRASLPWLALAAAALAAMVGLGLVTNRLVSLSSERNQAQRRAALDDATRLALWRLDTAAAALITAESARPVEGYVDAVVPQEGLSVAISGRFSRDPVKGPIRQGVVPAEEEVTRALAKPNASALDPAALGAATQQAQDTNLALKDEAAQSLVTLSLKRSAGEYAARSKAVQNSFAWTKNSTAYGNANEDELPADDKAVADTTTLEAARPAQAAKIARPPKTVKPAPRPEAGTFTERWSDGNLYLVRESRGPIGLFEQGAVLPWTLLEPLLRAEIRELLPDAVLTRDASPTDDPMRRMAALAIRLDPGPLPAADAPVATSVFVELTTLWAGVLAAFTALLVLLVGALRLSERRAAFVSAVTHELRTPLTTFRLYTEMLRDGMVPDEARRATYLQTLWSEAGRLSHLVDNVLAYSRIEQGRRPPAPAPLDLGPFIDRLRPRLEERLAQAGLSLVVKVPSQSRARAEPAALEQVVFNLIDNAAKYGRSTTTPTLELTVESGPRDVRLSVRDHGPGLSDDARRDLFVPFAKSAARAAETAPGVGLGLALCRRLVETVGGRLSHDVPLGGGARFTVTLPAA